VRSFYDGSGFRKKTHIQIAVSGQESGYDKRLLSSYTISSNIEKPKIYCSGFIDSKKPLSVNLDKFLEFSDDGG
jgi:hypothetical protein